MYIFYHKAKRWARTSRSIPDPIHRSIPDPTYKQSPTHRAGLCLWQKLEIYTVFQRFCALIHREFARQLLLPQCITVYLEDKEAAILFPEVSL